MNRFQITAALLATALAASTATAGLIASESFSYTGTTINGQGTAVNGWGGAWTVVQAGAANGHAFSSTSNLTYPTGVNLTPAGGSISGMSDEAAIRPLATPIDATQTRELWVSMLVKKTDTGAVRFGFESADGTRRLSWGFLSDEKMGLHVNSGVANAVRSVSTFANDASTLIVVKLALSEPTDTLSLKAFGPSDTVAAPSSFDVTHSGGSTLTFTKFYIEGLSSTAQVDEIRIGDTFGDVVAIPEPTAALFGAGAGMFALSTRRR